MKYPSFGSVISYILVCDLDFDFILWPWHFPQYLTMILSLILNQMVIILLTLILSLTRRVNLDFFDEGVESFHYFFMIFSWISISVSSHQYQCLTNVSINISSHQMNQTNIFCHIKEILVFYIFLLFLWVWSKERNCFLTIRTRTTSNWQQKLTCRC